MIVREIEKEVSPKSLLTWLGIFCVGCKLSELIEVKQGDILVPTLFALYNGILHGLQGLIIVYLLLYIWTFI